MSALSAFRERYLLRFWSPLPTLVALGVASAYYFALTGTFWAVTGEFTRWGGHVLSWFGVPVQDWSYFKIIGLQGTPLDRIDGVMIIGMFLGALCCALWAGNVSLRWPTSRRRLLQGLVGGIIAGFGARLAMGCNLAAFFTGIPMFSVHAGIDGEDALVCAVAALQAAYETNAMALEKASEPLRSLLVATENSLEKGLALASAVLDGIERG